jgi:Zn-dependent protease with chaperone function
MFYLLCLTLCLAVMFLVLSATAVLCLPAAHLLGRKLEQANARTRANVLLAFRLLPFLLAVAISFGLALPAFMKFEPPSTKEMVNAPLLLLAALGFGVLAWMTFRGVRMWRTTRFVQSEWEKHSQPLSSSVTSVPLYRIDTHKSLLAVTGVFNPRVYVSSAVVEALTEDELSAALLHEVAHVRSLDNLKQILMKIVAPPARFQRLQSTGDAWVRASEVAADESALAQGASALELSSALIKVSRLSMGDASGLPGSMAASHLVPCGCSSATLTRAAHLHELLERGTVATHESHGGKFRIAAALALGMMTYIVCLATLLPAVHEALEFLVR